MTAPALLLFARAPEAGRVKTRLVPALGDEGAALLYRAFLEDAARCYGPPASWSGVLWAEPDPGLPPLPVLFAPPWRREKQAPGDLGARLTAAFRDAFRHGAPAALAVGSDHPALPRRRLQEVWDRLDNDKGGEVVLIPAEDGGYCVIGMGRGAPVEELFRNVPWSSEAVLAVTLERICGAGLRAAVLDGSYDVDRPEDLARLRADLAGRDPSEPDYPRATAGILAAMDRGGPF